MTERAGASPEMDGRGQAQKSATVVGLGNIGSFLVGQLARMPELGRLILVDPDRYEPRNRGQDIMPDDIGHWKVDAQARRVRRLNAQIEVVAMRQPVEHVPLGRLRADVIVGALDTRIARMRLNEIAWRLGMPLVDTAVDGDALQARMALLRPGPDQPCLECTWDETDYKLLEQRYACSPEAKSAPTGAPPMPGAVLAAMAAVECHKIFSGDWDGFLAGRQVFFDLRHQTHFLTRLVRHDRCRFDHMTYHIEPAPAGAHTLTLEAAFEAAASTTGCGRGWEMRVEGSYFAMARFCANCATSRRDLLYIAQRVSPARLRCPKCKQARVIRGSDCVAWLKWDELRAAQRRRSLASLGLQPGDVYTIAGPGALRHFELPDTATDHPGRPKASRCSQQAGRTTE